MAPMIYVPPPKTYAVNSALLAADIEQREEHELVARDPDVLWRTC